jgi:TolB-like protein
MSQRRLAGIMFTDIVGYSSLLKEDEKKAFETLKKNQRIHRRLIKKFNGRWLKEMGEGILASFNSNIDAVMCAVSIKKAAEELDIPIRTGIHLGDVIFEKKDVLGDGVNIASRIQNAINTSGIVISEKVYSDIKNKEGLEIESLGTQKLKGVESPVDIYSVSCHDESVLDFTIDTGELVRPLSFRRATLVVGILVIAIVALALYYFLPRFTQSSSELGKSILVLPFNNYLGTDTLDYFVAGMHNELINDIGKISALSVKSKTTANAIKNTNKSIPEIADELEVNTFVETDVLCIGDSVCYQAKMFNREEKVLWTRDYKVEKSQILNLYNIVTKDISSELGIILTPEQERLLAKSRTVNRQAYDAYLKSFQGDASFESYNKTKEFLESAIEKDPDWAPLYANLAGVWIGLQHMGFESTSITVPKIYENLNKALELDPDLSDAHRFNASIAHWMEWDWEKSEKEFLKALAINPNDATSRIWYAQLLSTQQRPDEALMQGQLAFDLDPLNPMMKCWYGSLLTSVGDCEKALALADEVVAVDPEHFLAINVSCGAAFKCGDYDKVIDKEIQLMQMIGGNQFDEDTFKEIERIYDEQGFSAAYEEIASQMEVFAANNPAPVSMAMNYVYANQQDKAMDWLEKGYEMHNPQMIYITYYEFDPLFDNPRFIDLVEKMNLPLP